MNIDLTGQVALVTGGATGIGRAIVAHLLGCGANVVINDINAESLDKTGSELGNDVSTVVADVSQEDQVQHLLSQTRKQFGKLDILVNNAAVTAPVKPTLKQETGDWQRVMDINLRGTYLACRAAGEYLLEQKRGAIINISSLAGYVSMPASNDYGVSKAAVLMMTKTLAAEWGRHGIRVNAIAPGFMEAPMLERMLATTSVESDDYLRRIPMGRFGNVTEIAALVSYLASSWAEYITGVVIPVDGGWSVNNGP